MYEFADDSQTSVMDDWEDVDLDERLLRYRGECYVEDFLESISVSQPTNAMTSTIVNRFQDNRTTVAIR